MLAPTNLPSGHGLKQVCVESIASRHSDLNRLGKQIDRTPRYGSIIPELVFQPFFDILQGRMLAFFRYLALASHNKGHAVLARFSSAKQPILTTNFDVLIEAAGGAGVLHLHGDVDHEQELVFRINQVGKQLAPILRRKLLASIRDRTVYVLGYSGADRDIVSLLRESRCRRFVWFIHPKTRKNAPALLEALKLRQSCQFVVVDLNVLFRDLARTFGVTTGAGRNLTSERKRYIANWSRSIRTGEAWACLSRLLLLLERYEQARAVLMHGMRYQNRQLRSSWFLNEAANAMKLAGRFDEAQQLAKRALAHNRRPIDYPLRGGSLNIIGLSQLEQRHPQPKAALRELKKALDTVSGKAHSSSDRLLRGKLQAFSARLYNNMGLAEDQLNHWAAAIPLYKRSVRIKRKLGDLPGIAVTAANLCLAYYKRKQFANAARWKREALDIITRYEREFDRAYLLRRLGEISCDQGRTSKGVSLMREALRIYENNPDLAFGVQLTRDEIQSVLRSSKRSAAAARK